MWGRGSVWQGQGQGQGVGHCGPQRCGTVGSLLLLFVSVKQLIIIGPKNPFSLYVKCASVVPCVSMCPCVCVCV